MLRTILSAVFFLTTVVGSAQAATLTASGATGVEVNGVNYDVTFGDATCAAMYDGCDDASDFTFATMTEALAASNALRDLFNLAGNEQFTDTPSLTDGCTFVGLCRILTLTGQNAPEAGKWRFAAFRNNSSAGVSDFTYESCCATVGFTGGPAITYARWTVAPEFAVGAVPLPAGLPLLLTGFAGMVGLRMRKTRAKQV